LQAEIRHLRDLVLSLTASVFENVAVETSDHGDAVDQAKARRLFAEAEECFRLANRPDTSKEVARTLEMAGTELWARAFDIGMGKPRAKRKATSPDKD
jgi:hypothetical protein